MYKLHVSCDDDDDDDDDDDKMDKIVRTKFQCNFCV
jgi:hypothetical protein